MGDRTMGFIADDIARIIVDGAMADAFSMAHPFCQDTRVLIVPQPTGGFWWINDVSDTVVDFGDDWLGVWYATIGREILPNVHDDCTCIECGDPVVSIVARDERDPAVLAGLIMAGIGRWNFNLATGRDVTYEYAADDDTIARTAPADVVKSVMASRLEAQVPSDS